MNELLGWYGLPKMDNSDAHQLNISSYPISMSKRSPSRPASATSSLTPTPTANSGAASTKGCGRKTKDDSGSNKLPSDTNNNSNSCGADDEDEDDDDHDGIDDEDGHARDRMSSFQDSFSSGYEARGLISPASGGGEVPDSERGVAIICSWCQQNGNKLFTLESSGGMKSFCSEVCFTQCRRASFKRNKVCEWCKHVRHTLNFVDFQDGDVQLQFCSEKCLNQYKMNIFCTEARQHLEQIQNMAGEDAKKVIGRGKGGKHEKEILITPDLWLSAHTNTKVDIKEEVNDDEQETAVGLVKDSNVGSRRIHNGEESSEIQDSRWTRGVETRSVLSDHSSCSNEDRGSHKVKSLLMSRQKKDKPTSRYTNSNNGTKTSSDSCYQDRDRNRKSISGINGDSHSQEARHNTPCGKEKDAYPSVHAQKSATFPSAISAASFSPQHMSALSMMPNWATSQLLTMMPSHLNPSFGATNINSSLGGLGYMPNALLYSSLFGPNSLPMTVQKDTASSSMASSRNESRREALLDKSFERERLNTRGESTERSTRSTSSSYSSSDTPGPSSTPGATLSAVPEPASSFVPGFNQQLHHPLQTADLGQPLPIPHYLNDPALTGMFPLSYNLNHTQRNGPSVASGLPPAAHVPHHTPGPTTAPQQLTIPPVTVLVPYPIAVPIPIPVPIPLPIAPEKLFAFFKEKSTQNKTTSSTPGSQQWLPDHRSTSPQPGRSGAASVSHSISISPSVSSHNSPKAVPFLCHPFGSPMASLNSTEPALVLPSGRDSADSIITLRREISGSHKKSVVISPCSSTGLKRTSIPTRHLTLDASKKPRLDCPPLCSEDEAIDLSKMSSRSSSPRVSSNCSEKENSTVAKQASFSDTDADSSSQTSTLAVPRIHIITEHSDPPLCHSSAAVTLPSPPGQSNYSGRRSRILDAPSIPKKVRTPSPERRYVRTVPRDMVEAARRRGLRARVRTK